MKTRDRRIGRPQARPRLRAAAGDALELVTAGGTQMNIEIGAIDGVDFRVAIDSPVPCPWARCSPGGCTTGRKRRTCTFIALDAGGSRRREVLAVRLGDADRIATERSSERRASACPAFLARGVERHLRGVTVDASEVGIAVQLVAAMRPSAHARRHAGRLGTGSVASVASCAVARGRRGRPCSASRSPNISPEDRARFVQRSAPPDA